MIVRPRRMKERERERKKREGKKEIEKVVVKKMIGLQLEPIHGCGRRKGRELTYHW